MFFFCFFFILFFMSVDSYLAFVLSLFLFFFYNLIFKTIQIVHSVSKYIYIFMTKNIHSELLFLPIR